MIASLCVSNFISTIVAYNASLWMIDPTMSLVKTHKDIAPLNPLWNLQLPVLVKNNIALLLGVLLGAFVSYKNVRLVNRFAEICSTLSMFFLSRIFVPILPLFILGFMLKLSYDQVIFDIIKNNFSSVLSIIGVIVTYLATLFLIASGFSINKFLNLIKNIVPPALTAFTTMSSAAALPLSLKAAEANTGNPNASNVVMPTTVNIHLVGDSISIPMMAIIVLSSFGYGFPDFSSYLEFAIYFVMAKFAVAAVPGGGILVMVPILESKLGFTGEMSGLITAFYILLDPIISSANVIGNNAFCMFFTKAMEKLALTKGREQQNVICGSENTPLTTTS